MLRSLGTIRTVSRTLAPSRQIWKSSGVSARPAPARMQLERLGGGPGSPGGGGRGGGGPRRLCATGGSSDGGGSGKGGGLWAKYTEMLETSPGPHYIAGNCMNGAFHEGDIFCQLFVEGNGSLNVKRTVLFFTIGTAYVGPILYNWYGFLTKLIPGTGIPSVIGSLAMDQLVFAPVFVGSFIALFAFIDGKGVDGAKAKLNETWMDAVKVNWGIWVPAQFINFRFVPPQFRVFATNITALVWNTYISWSTYKKA